VLLCLSEQGGWRNLKETASGLEFMVTAGCQGDEGPTWDVVEAGKENMQELAGVEEGTSQ